jgi:hypothetical protein
MSVWGAHCDSHGLSVFISLSVQVRLWYGLGLVLLEVSTDVDILRNCLCLSGEYYGSNQADYQMTGLRKDSHPPKMPGLSTER